jgi:hypothetical protein
MSYSDPKLPEYEAEVMEYLKRHLFTVPIANLFKGDSWSSQSYRRQHQAVENVLKKLEFL